MSRIRQLLAMTSTTLHTLQQIHGNLNYAAEVAPFGKPFLAHLTNAIASADNSEVIMIRESVKVSLRL